MARAGSGPPFQSGIHTTLPQPRPSSCAQVRPSPTCYEPRQRLPHPSPPLRSHPDFRPREPAVSAGPADSAIDVVPAPKTARGRSALLRPIITRAHNPALTLPYPPSPCRPRHPFLCWPAAGRCRLSSPCFPQPGNAPKTARPQSHGCKYPRPPRLAGPPLEPAPRPLQNVTSLIVKTVRPTQPAQTATQAETRDCNNMPPRKMALLHAYRRSQRRLPRGPWPGRHK